MWWPFRSASLRLPFLDSGGTLWPAFANQASFLRFCHSSAADPFDLNVFGSLLNNQYLVSSPQSDNSACKKRPPSLSQSAELLHRQSVGFAQSSQRPLRIDIWQLPATRRFDLFDAICNSHRDPADPLCHALLGHSLHLSGADLALFIELPAVVAGDETSDSTLNDSLSIPYEAAICHSFSRSESSSQDGSVLYRWETESILFYFSVNLNSRSSYTTSAVKLSPSPDAAYSVEPSPTPDAAYSVESSV